MQRATLADGDAGQPGAARPLVCLCHRAAPDGRLMQPVAKGIFRIGTGSIRKRAALVPLKRLSGLAQPSGQLR